VCYSPKPAQNGPFSWCCYCFLPELPLGVAFGSVEGRHTTELVQGLKMSKCTESRWGVVQGVDHHPFEQYFLGIGQN
jgi:hypothetical protein